MKKIIAMLLACMMVIGMFAACAPAGTNNNTTTAPSTKPSEAKPEEITLKVWGPAEDQGDESKWLNTMLKKFEEAHIKLEEAYAVF